MTVRDSSDRPCPMDSVFEARVASNQALEVLGAQHLPLRPHEWSLAPTDDSIERLLPDE